MYGKLIFIKKTGGDGSKYPVTEKNITIGRIEECLIRIYNPQVEEQHCQLIVNDSGQVILKNLSKRTFLNGKPLGLGEVPLSHGDIFKVGDRSARWEYLPSSKFYQKLSPSDKSSALAKSIKKSLDFPSTSGPSTSQVSLYNHKLQGTQGRFSERAVTAKSASRSKVLKVNSANKIPNGAVSMFKILSKRHSLQCRKMLFSPNVRPSQSTSEVNDYGSKTPKTRSEKFKEINSLKAKSATPPKNKMPVRRQSTPIKKPLSIRPAGKLGKSLRQSSLAVNLNAIPESSPKGSENLESSPVNSRQSLLAEKEAPVLLVTPKKKNLSSKERLVNSEKKVNSSGKDFISGRWPKTRKLSLTSQTIEKPIRLSSFKKEYRDFSKKSTSPAKSRGKSKSNSTLDLENSSIHSPKNAAVTKPLNSSNDSFYNSPSSIGINKSILGNENTFSHKKPISSNKRLSTPRSRVSKNLTPNSSLDTNTKHRSSTITISQVKKKSKLNQKALNSLAKEAAIKLKTSSTLKPDKNKKAALLVLGKASWKQVPALNVKMLLKKKAVKKAIKQSSRVSVSKNLKMTKVAQRKQTKSKEKKKKMVKGIRKDNTSDQTEGESEIQSSIKSLKSVTKSKSADELAETINSTDKTTPSKCNTKFSNEMLADSSISNDASKLSQIEAKSPNGCFFGSDRRCSKRLSSKNNVSQPDFMELSPTALGLIPRTFEVFKTPTGSRRRRSISLVTPKVNYSSGIIKSASTQKIKNSKNLRFSSKNLSDHSNTSAFEKTPFKFENIQTPDISLDVFVSPLTESSFGDISSSKILKAEVDSTDKDLKQLKASGRGGRRSKCAQKLMMSPESNGVPELTFSSAKRKAVRESLENVTKKIKASNSSESKSAIKDLENELTDVNKMCQIPTPSKEQKNLKSELEDFGEVKKLFRSRRIQKSPKNDLTDVRGVKKLFRSPKVQKSPKNDLSDLRGVKKLFRSPKVQKSPKNDLSDLRGVKKLFRSPKIQKSPKNDLTDVRGVKKLFRSPKVQKSPKNDLSDLRGVKKLFRSPKIQKSPKNDLSDVRGVKKLFRSPKVQKSPKNDLSDLRGVKKLFRSPKIQKSPKNDLTDVRGVKKLFRSPKVQKSPKNDLSDLRGVKKLFRSPKVQKSPKNDLSNLEGIKELFQSEIRADGLDHLLSTSQSKRSPKSVMGVNKLLIAKISVDGDETKFAFFDSHLGNLNNVREKRRSSTNQTKNDLSDVTGVRELFSRNKPINDLNISLTGVAELFSFSSADGISESQKMVTRSTRSRTALKTAKPATEILDQESPNAEAMVLRGRRLRKAANNTENKSTGRKKELTADSEEGQTIDSERTSLIKLNKSECEKYIENLKEGRQTRGKRKLMTQEAETSTTFKDIETEVPIKRTRSCARRNMITESSPPKQRRRRLNEDCTTPKRVTRGTSKTANGEGSEKKRTGVARKSVAASTKVSRNLKTVPKVQSKTRATESKESPKSATPKSQRTSRRRAHEKESDSKAKVSPRRTRSQVARSRVKK